MKITITGPRSIGKSTISKIVAKKLKLKYISPDEIGEEAFKKHGGLDKVIKSGKIIELIKTGSYELILKEYKKDNFVFDLSGGSFSSKKFPESSEEVRKTAKENSVIVGLLPSKDAKESIRILFKRERDRTHFKDAGPKWLLEKARENYFRFPHLFKKYSALIVYTKDKAPAKIADEIIKRVKKLK